MMKIEHDFEFDPTCGYSEADLLAMGLPETEPEDFCDFWQDTYEQTLQIKSEISQRRIWSPSPDVAVYELRYKSFGGIDVGAWLSVPKNPVGGIVEGHGYGGIARPSLYDDFAVIAPCIRGFNLSNSPDIPWNSAEHVIHGIENKESYVLRGSVADIWRAASVLLELFPGLSGNLNYTGGSFGGGLGALSVPWERRLKTAYWHVPTFGHHPSRLLFQSTGSGESVRKYHANHPEAVEVLKYFDAATAAQYVKIPVLCSPALFDPCVLPPGQFAVNNAVPEQYRTTVIYPAGHYFIKENVPVQEKIDKLKREMFASV